MAVWMMENS